MEQSTHEIWRPVVGYEGMYEVSTVGRVRSLPRFIKYSNRDPVRVGLRVLKTPVSGDGYHAVSLHRDGQRKMCKVHSLMMAAFVGPRPLGMDVRHLDGDEHNNTLSNLTYGTRSQNIMDNVTHGTHNNARKTHCKRGHPFIPENTLWSKGGRTRLCRACEQARGVAKRVGKPLDTAVADVKFTAILASADPS